MMKRFASTIVRAATATTKRPAQGKALVAHLLAHQQTTSINKFAVRNSSTSTSTTSNNNGATKKNPKVLITGCLGQIGTELVTVLRQKYGHNNVIASDVTKPATDELREMIAPFRYADVTNYDHLAQIVVEEQVLYYSIST
eukprot:GEZU01013939.1.p1 GENE.GEZU01013939.1~~GEZU01013939.1.p1  ORF type:complete len:141 (+),score=31.01 GEZU01013939.1:58-480(+)